MPLQLNIHDEISTLDTVILGIAEDRSGPGLLNPKSKFHLEHGSYPSRKDLECEMNAFRKVLVENGVKVLHPQNMKNKTQLFTRDLGFVIGDRFFISHMKENRQKEVQGIQYLIDLFDPSYVTDISKHEKVCIEGGDVVIRGNTVFVGLSTRTNKAGVEFLKEQLGDEWNVEGIRLVVDEKDHETHALHLDCVFQPVGDRHAIIHEKGIRDLDKFMKLLDLPEENIFFANEWQFVSMFTNVLSLSKDTVVIENEFIELKYWLEDKGFRVIEVPFREISKLSGLLRCCTLPLIRK